MGVSRAAGWTSVGEYLQILSCLWEFQAGVVHDSVMVFVMILSSLVHVNRGTVMVCVRVVKTAGGMTVLVILAVFEGSVWVMLGSKVDVKSKVDVSVEVITGVEVILNDTVGVNVSVT